MTPSVQTIPFIKLSLTFIPVLIVIGIIWKWGFDYMTHVYAVFRMLLQLLLIGYLLAFIFKSNSPYIIVIVLTVMLSASSWNHGSGINNTICSSVTSMVHAKLHDSPGRYDFC